MRGARLGKPAELTHQPRASTRNTPLPPSNSLGAALRPERIPHDPTLETAGRALFGSAWRRAKNESETSSLRLVACRLFGNNYQTVMAHGLNVCDRTVRRWVSGSSPVPHGITAELIVLGQDRLEEIRTALSVLEHRQDDAGLRYAIAFTIRSRIMMQLAQCRYCMSRTIAPASSRFMAVIRAARRTVPALVALVFRRSTNCTLAVLFRQQASIRPSRNTALGL